MKTMRFGRNGLCQCGSGKKFKRCCLAGQTRFQQVLASPIQRVSPTPRPRVQQSPDGIPEYVIVKNKGRTHRSKLEPGDECELRDGTWAIYRPDLMNDGSVRVRDKGWVPERELKPGDQYECNGVWVTFQPERVIGTTDEHPFYVWGKGWTALRDIQPGELIRTEDGWVPVKSVENTGRVVPVYNLQVEDDHTYFVGAPSWGFSVWAHNTCEEVIAQTRAAAAGEGEAQVARIAAILGKDPAEVRAALLRAFDGSEVTMNRELALGPDLLAQASADPSNVLLKSVFESQRLGHSADPATVAQAIAFRTQTEGAALGPGYATMLPGETPKTFAPNWSGQLQGAADGFGPVVFSLNKDNPALHGSAIVSPQDLTMPGMNPGVLAPFENPVNALARSGPALRAAGLIGEGTSPVVMNALEASGVMLKPYTVAEVNVLGPLRLSPATILEVRIPYLPRGAQANFGHQVVAMQKAINRLGIPHRWY